MECAAQCQRFAFGRIAGGVVLNSSQVEPNSVERVACNVKKNIMIL